MQNSVFKYTFSWENIHSIHLILKGVYDDKKVMKYFLCLIISYPSPEKATPRVFLPSILSELSL